MRSRRAPRSVDKHDPPAETVRRQARELVERAIDGCAEEHRRVLERLLAHDFLTENKLAALAAIRAVNHLGEMDLITYAERMVLHAAVLPGFPYTPGSAHCEGPRRRVPGIRTLADEAVGAESSQVRGERDFHMSGRPTT